MFGRFFYAFAMAVTILMATMVVDMVFGFDIGEYIFSPYIFFPVVAVCYGYPDYVIDFCGMQCYSKTGLSD